jgi:hypothetical protein
MAMPAKQLERITGELLGASPTTCVGRVAAITDDGRVLVSYPGCRRDSVQALLVQPMPTGQPFEFKAGDAVLLVFDEADSGLPIVVGTLCDRMQREEPVSREKPNELTVDGRRVVIEGKEEIVLKCGRASVTLRADGRLQIKGEHVVSRAVATNALRGGTVRIN